jgi:ferrous iron transport protein A
MTTKPVSLSLLPPKSSGWVRSVGSPDAALTAAEQRLIELGFVTGERVEVLTQIRPGNDPFVVRVADTTFALRRHEVARVWVDLAASAEPSP